MFFFLIQCTFHKYHPLLSFSVQVCYNDFIPYKGR